MDDATSTLMELRFVKSESTFSYFEALEGYLLEHGRPVAFYSDKHTVFRVANGDAKGGARITQFGRALSELNVEILCANTSQAKGRVERANRTLQDRLVKELRLAGISDMGAGNAYLQGFKERHNAKFAKAPAKPDNLHRALNVEPDRLADVLCWRENRYVGKQLTFYYDRKRIMLEESDITRGLIGKYVDTYAFVDGRFEVRSKGRSLPYKSSTWISASPTQRSPTTSDRALFLNTSKRCKTPPRPSRRCARTPRRWVTSQTDGDKNALLEHGPRRRLHTQPNSLKFGP